MDIVVPFLFLVLKMAKITEYMIETNV